MAIFSDALNHACLIDGARLAVRQGCQLHVYRHRDTAHLSQLLRACARGVRKLVVTDGVFSMDGTLADLPVRSPALLSYHPLYQHVVQCTLQH